MQRAVVYHLQTAYKETTEVSQWSRKSVRFVTATTPEPSHKSIFVKCIDLLNFENKNENVGVCIQRPYVRWYMKPVRKSNS